MIDDPRSRSPAQAAVFAWPFLGAVLVAGLGGVWMSRRAGIPDLLDVRVLDRRPALRGHRAADAGPDAVDA